MADPTFQWPGIPVEPSPAPSPAPNQDLNVGMTPMPRLQLPSGGELNPSEINSLVGTAISMRKMQEENRAAAIRYQGQMEYQQLISQGADPADALRRTLHKISFGSPTTFTSGIADLARERRERDIQLHYQELQKERERHNRAVEEHYRSMETKKPDLTPLKSQLTGVNSRIRQAEGKMAANVPEEQRTAAVTELQTLYDERDAIQSAIQEAGGKVAITPRPSFETVPQVSTPPDMRSGLSRILPNFLGGSPPPGPITNMVTRMMPPTLAPKQAVVSTNAPSGETIVNTNAPPFEPPPSKGKLTEEKAKHFLNLAKGNKAMARKMAIDDGWEL